VNPISEGYQTNKSMHHISRRKEIIPPMFTSATPIRQNQIASDRKCVQNSSNILPSGGFSISQGKVDNLPSLFELRNGCANKISEIAEKVGFKLPRSLSQPRTKLKFSNNMTQNQLKKVRI